MHVEKANMLFDSTYNFHPDCANDDEHRVYGRGILVGLVGGFMAGGMTFEQALFAVKSHSRDCVSVCVPDCWKNEWCKLPYAGMQLYEYLYRKNCVSAILQYKTDHPGCLLKQAKQAIDDFATELGWKRNNTENNHSHCNECGRYEDCGDDGICVSCDSKLNGARTK